MQPATWTQTEEARQLLASCGANEPPFRQDRDGLYRYQNSDPRVRDLRKLEKAAWEATFAECQQTGDYNPCKAHVTVYEAIQVVCYPNRAAEFGGPKGLLAVEALELLRAA